jgi:hypothetical protein
MTSNQDQEIIDIIKFIEEKYLKLNIENNFRIPQEKDIKKNIEIIKKYFIYSSNERWGRSFGDMMERVLALFITIYNIEIKEIILFDDTILYNEFIVINKKETLDITDETSHLINLFCCFYKAVKYYGYTTEEAINNINMICEHLINS